MFVQAFSLKQKVHNEKINSSVSDFWAMISNATAGWNGFEWGMTYEQTQRQIQDSKQFVLAAPSYAMRTICYRQIDAEFEFNSHVHAIEFCFFKAKQLNSIYLHIDGPKDCQAFLANLKKPKASPTPPAMTPIALFQSMLMNGIHLTQK